jgi:hypothetical protein
MSEMEFTSDCLGMSSGKPTDPCCIVVFGAAGDLAQRELIPALYDLACQALLPEPFTIVGFSIEDLDDDAFRDMMRRAVTEHRRFDPSHWERFAPHLHFVQGDFDAPPGADYARLRDRLASLQKRYGIPDNVLFHLATPPAFFCGIVGRLEQAGLAMSERGWRRLVIEKPFGTDAQSARALDRRILEVFHEDQTYRIDHFLGKETVQNLLVVRFANPGFEPIWNRNYIDHVQITVAEDIGIGKRAGFYEKTGVVRDMVQNHLMQLLCITAIEPPVRYDANGLRDETVKVMEAIRPLNVRTDAVRGQYGPGRPGRGPGLPRGAGRGARLGDGDLRGAAGDDRQLALGGCAVLPENRQTAGAQAHRGGDPFQADAAPDVPGDFQRSGRQYPRVPAATGGGHHSDLRGQAARSGIVPAAGYHEFPLRQRVRRRAAAQGLFLAAARRHGRRPDAVRARRLDLPRLADRGAADRLLGGGNATRFSELPCRLMGAAGGRGPAARGQPPVENPLRRSAPGPG